MKLTKDDFDCHETEYRCKMNEEKIDQILKNQEDAHNGIKLLEWFENSKLEAVKEHKIVERLKKRIEELGTGDTNWSLNDKHIRDELQKILDDKDETN